MKTETLSQFEDIFIQEKQRNGFVETYITYSLIELWAGNLFIIKEKIFCK